MGPTRATFRMQQSSCNSVRCLPRTRWCRPLAAVPPPGGDSGPLGLQTRKTQGQASRGDPLLGAGHRIPSSGSLQTAAGNSAGRCRDQGWGAAEGAPNTSKRRAPPAWPRPSHAAAPGQPGGPAAPALLNTEVADGGRGAGARVTRAHVRVCGVAHTQPLGGSALGRLRSKTSVRAGKRLGRTSRPASHVQCWNLHCPTVRSGAPDRSPPHNSRLV